MAEFLLEVFTEEVPARMQSNASEQLKKNAEKQLSDLGLTFNKVDVYHTPRRLVLHVDGLPQQQDDIHEERKGPKVDAPPQALEGFLRSAGVSREDCEERDMGKGVFLFAVIHKKGSKTADVLPDFVASLIKSTAWPKSMKWAENQFTWVRPIKHIVAIFDGQVIEGSFDLIGSTLSFTNQTVGHRFLSPGAFTVESFAQYKAALNDGKVVLDPATRRQMILDQAGKITADRKLSLKNDEGLLREVVNLVSYPKVLIGEIEPGFMQLPDEVLSTSMKVHQKYFSVIDDSGKLAPYFVFVANSDQGTENIVKGNERVLRARLNDAKFFWEQDLKIPANQRAQDLSKIVFHEKLGTVSERVKRLESLSEYLAKQIGCSAGDAKRAAQLCKTDLVSHMVYEFPELQGIMGGYYAEKSGETVDVVQAIKDHYSPAGPSDECPKTPVSTVVALADKIDVLAGFFAIDLKPTGSKDPFALRRAALGVIRLILENDLRLSLREVFDVAVKLYQKEAVTDDLMTFVFDRLTVYVRDQGISHGVAGGVFVKHAEGDLTLLMQRLKSVARFIGTDDGANLLAGYKRAANILSIESKKDSVTYEGHVDALSLAEESEKKLMKAIENTKEMTKSFVESENFEGAMTALAQLRSPVDSFFENVMVNSDDENLRKNRLNLLSLIVKTMDQVALFSKVEG